MLHTTLAYKYVMTAAMIGFVNHYAPQLGLPVNVPLKDKEIILGVSSPENDKVMALYGGGIRVNNYEFGFSELHDRTRYAFVSVEEYFTVTKLEDDGMTSFGIPLQYLHEPSTSLMERASRMKYTVTTNQFYEIASNYLIALDIDSATIVRRNRLTIEQRNFSSDRGPVPSPRMQAYWGDHKLRDPGRNGAAFMISSVSGQLLEMSVGNELGCKGLPLIKDFDQLLAISDDEFSRYSDLDRSNLVVHFANLPSKYLPASTNLYYWFPQTNHVSTTNAAWFMH